MLELPGWITDWATIASLLVGILSLPFVSNIIRRRNRNNLLGRDRQTLGNVDCIEAMDISDTDQRGEVVGLQTAEYIIDKSNNRMSPIENIYYGTIFAMVLFFGSIYILDALDILKGDNPLFEDEALLGKIIFAVMIAIIAVFFITVDMLLKRINGRSRKLDLIRDIKELNLGTDDLCYLRKKFDDYNAHVRHALEHLISKSLS